MIGVVTNPILTNNELSMSQYWQVTTLPDSNEGFLSESLITGNESRHTGDLNESTYLKDIIKNAMF
jgi:hypothetical protein